MRAIKIYIISIFILFAFINVNAQINLVLNGDFENYSSIPTWAGQSNLAIGWNNVNGDYTGYPYGSPDYLYNPISGILVLLGPINPISGNGQMGLDLYDIHDPSTPNYREYISTKLTSKMLKRGFIQV